MFELFYEVVRCHTLAKLIQVSAFIRSFLLINHFSQVDQPRVVRWLPLGLHHVNLLHHLVKISVFGPFTVRYVVSVVRLGFQKRVVLRDLSEQCAFGVEVDIGRPDVSVSLTHQCFI